VRPPRSSVDRLHLLRLPDQVAEAREVLELLLERAVGLLDAVRLQRLGEEGLETRHVERLLKVVVRPFPHRRHRAVHRGAARDDDHLAGDARLAHLGEEGQPVQLRHAQIGQHDAVSAAALDHLPRRLPVGGGVHFISVIRQEHLEPLDDVALVVRYQNLLKHAVALRMLRDIYSDPQDRNAAGRGQPVAPQPATPYADGAGRRLCRFTVPAAP
jgi:hypothetical protein